MQRAIAVGLLVIGHLLALPANAPAQSATVQSVRTVVEEPAGDHLDQLEMRLAALERQRDSVLRALRAPRPTFTSGPEGFSLVSADQAFRVRFRGYFQADNRVFAADHAAPAVNSVLIRRARPIFEATMFRFFDLRFMPDFADGRAILFDGHFDIRLMPALSLRAGKFKPPVSLERLQSATDLRFGERGLTTNLAPNRDVGIQLYGDVRALSYAIGMFDGTPDLGNGDNDGSDAKDFVGRLFVEPLRGLGLGIAASVGREDGTLGNPGLPAYRTPGQQVAIRFRTGTTLDNTSIANGSRRRVAPQGYFYSGPFGASAEYTVSSQDVTRGATSRVLTHRGFQFAASWFLTGETASYRSVSPRKMFYPSAGQWGAVELAVRYGAVLADPDAFPFFADPASAVSRETSWGVGLNWHFARNIKIMLNYERTWFRDGDPGGNRPPEHFVVTRFQTAF